MFPYFLRQNYNIITLLFRNSSLETLVVIGYFVENDAMNVVIRECEGLSVINFKPLRYGD